MYQDDKNEYGCPLFDQNGRAGIRDFDAIVARLAPELRAAFEAERAARFLEMKRTTGVSGPEWWEYQRVAAAVRQLWLTQPRLRARKDALAEQIRQLHPWLLTWQARSARRGAAAASVRGVQAIPVHLRRLREWVPTYRPSIAATRAIATQPLGSWLGLVDDLLDRGRRSCSIGRTAPGRHAAAARRKRG